MSKRKQVKDSIQNRTNPLDNMMYGEGGDLGDLGDEFFSNIDDSSQQLQEENEQLRQEIVQLQEKLGSNRQLLRGDELRLGDFTVTPTRLIIPDSVTSEQLAEVGNILFRLEGSLQWLLGDWLVSVEDETWGKMEAIAEHFDRKVKTLYDYKYVAKNVQFSVRTENLSFQHHTLVAGMPEDQQAHYLRMAEIGDADPDDHQTYHPWSVARLRAQIKADNRPALPSAEPSFDLRASVKTARNVFKVVRDGARGMSERKREEALYSIDVLRRLLDDAERKLKDEE